ncbi:hypothetical protein CDAR_59831 [Caerostris darwini]|uniref:Uncharacterized protein n=1 Tax=Caerostris darwini TaxID=1538125 RepID=A0AAV4RT18_9ARAC|nr:hypothetical protein CDAR_59831 [Caerostris darwini]
MYYLLRAAFLIRDTSLDLLASPGAARLQIATKSAQDSGWEISISHINQKKKIQLFPKQTHLSVYESPVQFAAAAQTAVDDFPGGQD